MGHLRAMSRQAFPLGLCPHFPVGPLSLLLLLPKVSVQLVVPNILLDHGSFFICFFPLELQTACPTPCIVFFEFPFCFLRTNKVHGLQERPGKEDTHQLARPVQVWHQLAEGDVLCMT